MPTFYVDRIKNDLGDLWKWLPKESLEHDPNAYLKAEQAKEVVQLKLGSDKKVAV